MTEWKILLVDDEPVVLRVIRLALEKAGYQVETRPNGLAALERIREQPPDVLITDIEMPQMSGQELCQKLEAEMPDRRSADAIPRSAHPGPPGNGRRRRCGNIRASWCRPSTT